MTLYDLSIICLWAKEGLLPGEWNKLVLMNAAQYLATMM